MSTNYLTAAITAYEALSEAEKELFYKVVYRLQESDCCAADEPKETSEKDASNLDLRKLLNDYVGKVSNPSYPDTVGYPITPPYTDKYKSPYILCVDNNGHVSGLGLYTSDTFKG